MYNQLSGFESMRHMNKNGEEYWLASEFATLLGYENEQDFQRVIEQATISCERSGQSIQNHFVNACRTAHASTDEAEKTQDYALSRLGCYLIAQNSDPAGKFAVSFAQTYIAMQTCRREIADAKLLADQSSVIQPQDFAIFQNHGYRGLYGGETEDLIHARKRLQPQEKILDYMGSDELAYNAFRASLTKQKIEKEQIEEKTQANAAHFAMGKEVRDTIIRTGAALPEELPTPAKSIQQIQQEEQKRLQQGPQLLLFTDGEDLVL